MIEERSRFTISNFNKRNSPTMTGLYYYFNGIPNKDYFRFLMNCYYGSLFLNARDDLNTGKYPFEFNTLPNGYTSFSTSRQIYSS
jgi:hypothetical protein